MFNFHPRSSASERAASNLMAKKKKVKFKSKPKKSKLLMFLVTTFFILLVGGILALYAGYQYYTRDLPDFTVVTGYKPRLKSEVYSADGTLIGEFAAERRKIIRYENIPPHVRNAFIAVEDRRFFEHEGVDVKSIIAAMLENIQEGDWVRGASTITQQVIKNIILTPERTISRKIKEAILAYRIENNLSKEEILFLYLNHIYLADGTYGVEVASRNYFGKSAKDINIAEAALLAGLPKKPEYYSPRNHLVRALERQKTVLRRMSEGGFITEDERLDAESFEIEIKPRLRVNSKLAPYFVEHVRRYLEKTVGTKEFLNGGYTVFTTLDVDLNLEAQWAVKRGLLDLESRRGRKVVVKNLSNDTQIKKYLGAQNLGVIQAGDNYEAVVTSIEKNKNSEDKESPLYTAAIALGDNTGELRYAVSPNLGDPVPGLSSPYTEKFAPADGYRGLSLVTKNLKKGDVIKVKAIESSDGEYEYVLNYSPETQAALVAMDTGGNIRALVGGYDYRYSQFNRTTQAIRQPGSAFKPVVYSAAIDKGYTETSVLYDMPVVIKDWAPQNYDGKYEGAIVLRTALAKSRNLATVRLMLDIDPKYVVSYAKNFGFETEFNPYPSLALGGADVKVMEMVKAYNVFANEGKLVEPVFILRIYDRNGRIIEDNTGGQFVSKEESLKANREAQRQNIIRALAKEKGRDADALTSKSEFLEENELSDTDGFTSDSSEYKFFNPAEFLELVRSGSVDFLSGGEEKQTLSPETAYIMSDLLQAVIKEGTGRRAARLTSLAPLGGKTGTTNEYTDAWFVGFSPRITTAVWVGRDDHKTIGKKEAGSRAALPIWIDFMEDALEKYPGGKFKRPLRIKTVSTPYGNVPYSIDSLRENVLDSLRDRVMIDGGEFGNESIYVPSDYGLPKNETETEIDFLLRR
jgi:penicillin-binding protein 1A